MPVLSSSNTFHPRIGLGSIGTNAIKWPTTYFLSSLGISSKEFLTKWATIGTRKKEGMFDFLSSKFFIFRFSLLYVHLFQIPSLHVFFFIVSFFLFFFSLQLLIHSKPIISFFLSFQIFVFLCFCSIFLSLARYLLQFFGVYFLVF